MQLSQQDIRLFYDLFARLLDQFNEALHLVPNFRFRDGKDWDGGDVMKIALIIPEHPDLVDACVAANPDLDEDAKAILSSWKKAVHSTFAVERYLKKGTVFIDVRDSEVYLVQSLTTDFEEMYFMMHLPFLVETTLLPFRDQITYASSTYTKNIYLGGGFRAQFKEAYNDARKAGTIHTSL